MTFQKIIFSIVSKYILIQVSNVKSVGMQALMQRKVQRPKPRNLILEFRNTNTLTIQQIQTRLSM